jgi:hypothetical protein
MSEIKILSDLYNSVFQSQVSTPSILVDYKLWNRILDELPADYILPDPRIEAALSKR